AHPGPAGAAADLERDGQLDAARLGDRRSRGRAWRQRRALQAGRGRRRERRQDRWLSQCAGPHRRLGLEPLRQEPLQLHRDPERKEREEARRQLGRRYRQGDRAHARRRRGASEFRAQKRRVTAAFEETKLMLIVPPAGLADPATSYALLAQLEYITDASGT